MSISREIARRLSSAYTEGPIAPVADDLPERTIDAAYAVQLEQLRMWRDTGRRIAGRKIGLTSAAVQKQLGVDMPDFGFLMEDMVEAEGSTLDFTRLQQPKAEAEIALVLARDLDLEEPDHAAVLAATAYACPALEIVASRIADWKITIHDTIADNASSGLVVLGDQCVQIADLDLTACAMTMQRNGEIVSRGTGADCLGNPLEAAVWLARTARAYGNPLRAGEVILTGALGPMATVQPGDRIHAAITGIGEVSCQFTSANQELTA